MPNMMKYANLVHALTTLAAAPVAAFPESGAMGLAMDAKDRSAGYLATLAAEEAAKKAKKKEKKASLLKTAGTVAGAAVGGFIPGGSVAMAGLGASLGGELGSAAGGGGVSTANVADAFAMYGKRKKKSTLDLTPEQWGSI